MKRFGTIVAAFLTAPGCGGSSSTPAESVKATLMKANEGKYTEANEGLTEETA